MTEPAAPHPVPGTSAPREVADAVAAAVLAHPDVERLDGGPFGAVASYLPGRRLLGVRVGGPAEPAQVAVVVRFGTPLPALAESVAQRVRAVLGPVPVDVTFADVVLPVAGSAAS
ncbi:hypothetical protein [Pseudonocardia sp. N23]|uniref:hypothetical protein n=1 Tax=Pseudonocardia sp. N23 TaxID=1987376 RepID=UPI000C035636|nr:hypothetical protein [Pseudonocardia sp. N23]GAY12138.1 hypothetical protein TOK_0528 [Pseudonocardia sp. N23]